MLEDKIRQLATAKNYAVLSTLMPDGQPQSQVVWVDADDEHLIVNTVVTHQKFKNVERDPRATVTIIDAANPYRYAEVRGRVVEVIRGDEARAHIDALSQRYLGHPYDREITAERVILKIAPIRQRTPGR